MDARAVDPLIARTSTAGDVVWCEKARSASITIVVKVSALIAD